jgi:hypothetical protein
MFMPSQDRHALIWALSAVMCCRRGSFTLSVPPRGGCGGVRPCPTSVPNAVSASDGHNPVVSAWLGDCAPDRGRHGDYCAGRGVRPERDEISPARMRPATRSGIGPVATAMTPTSGADVGSYASRYGGASLIVGPLISYEATFSDLPRREVQLRAQLLAYQSSTAVGQPGRGACH